MTSLSQQLRRLAVPQTSNLVDLKKRPSILFEPDVAATKDKKTIYDLGCQGISELIALNSAFKQFEDTLFEQTSLNVERAVEDPAFNVKLNRNIKKFFHHLSPYFMLRSSHLCLEWLIRRYMVHEYNKDDFVALIIPYHETNIFVKCVQIMKIKTPSDPWHFLYPLQRPGVPLPKSTIFTRAGVEPSFLKFVCNNVVDATKELGNRAPTLQCLINFYCSVVIGALESRKRVEEWHITSILPSLIRGMKSGVTDFISASFMITTQLVNKTHLTPKLLNQLIIHIWKVDCEALQNTSILLLNWIAKTHVDVLTHFPQTGFLEFIEKKWVNNTINTLSREGISMLYLTIPLINTAFQILQNDIANADTCKQYIENLLYEVQFTNQSARKIIKCILMGLSVKKSDDKKALKDGDVIDLESDDEMPSQENVMRWFTKILGILERQYPNDMDVVIKKAMEDGSGAKSKNAIQAVLALRYKFLNENTSSIFENIYHNNPKIRAISIKEIVSQINKKKYDPQNYNLLKEVLADRINDDSEKVVEEILKIPTNVCVDILGIQTFVDNIIKILDKATTNPDNWAYLQTPALLHLTSKTLVENFDTNVILLAVTRFLIPIKINQENSNYIKLILRSSLADKKPFFRTLIERKNDIKFDLVNFKQDFLNVLSLSNDTPRAEDLVESMEKNGENYIKTPAQMSHFLIIVTACFKTKNDIENAFKIYDFTMKQCLQFRIALSTDKEQNLFNNVPLQNFTEFLDSIVRGTNFENLHDWKSDSKSLQLFLSIFSVLTTKGFSPKLDKNEKLEWTKSLRNIFHSLFPTTKQKLSFLSQFLIYETLNGVENYTETRIRALRLLEVVLRGGHVEGNDIDLRFILKTIVALSSPLATVRECAVDILQAAKGFNENLSNLIGNIIERNEEIHFDAEQIPLILFTILTSKRNTSDNALINDILNIIDDPAEYIEFKSKVFEILKHIKSVDILNSMIPAALSSLDNIQTVGNIKILDEATANIFRSVIIRFDEKCIREVITANPKAWQLIERSIKMTKVFLNLNGKLTPVPSITLQILEEENYNQLPNEYKIKLLKLIIETISLSDNDTLFLDVNKALKKCTLDCKHVLPLLEAMINNKNENEELQKKKRPVSRATAALDNSLLNSNHWKEGIVLLEILENKKKLQNTQVLIPVLFDTLKRCLDMEIQSTAEYSKQLILSALLHCCQKSKAENLLNTISESTFRIDLIVQCIRVTQNPQTHYNALLFLSHCAILFPQQVLHNLVDIFTFMGSSITRHDDAFSFQIISNIVESIIPILVGDNKSKVDKNKRVVPVLKIFSDILLDVPEHRRTPLYTKLLSILGAEEYFWLFLCVVFESHVISEAKNKSNKSTSAGEKLPKRIEVVLKLLNEFSTTVSIKTCISLLDYVKRLPMDKDKEGTTTVQSTLEDNDLFNVKTRDAKQLRHYKYLILQFVSTFTSSVDFLTAISILTEDEIRQNKSLYQHLIIKTLSYIPDVTQAIEKSKDNTQVKFWKVILHHCYDALDNIISLLSPDMFLIAVFNLMQHKMLTIRKKVIELLIGKLQKNSNYFIDCVDENVLNVLNSLCEAIGAIAPKDLSKNSPAPVGNETILVQQVALIAIKLLSKMFALKHKEQFKNILEHLTEITKKRARLSKVIIATVILTLVEVISNLKVHGVVHLPKFMPHVVDALQDQSSILQNQAPDNVCIALITGVQKLFEAMPLFLGPYVVGIVSALSTIWFRTKQGDNEQEQKRLATISKLESIWKKIATEVPARILIPNCEKAYYSLMSEGNFPSISYLMKLFFECVSNASNSDLSAVQLELTNFFLKCLEFRAQMSSSGGSTSMDDICTTEMEIINAFVAWILKLSESSFRPVYKKVYDWGFEKDGPKERVLTYFILNKCISDSLKSLFVLFSSDFIQDAAQLLSTCNTSKSPVLYFENSDQLNVELLKNILSTLGNIFLYDTKGFSNSHRFDILMQPIVDQMENKLILENEELQQILLLCTGQLAVAVSSDVLWKQLHYQILLKTRSNVPEVRILAFNCCVELARKLGDDFTSLLPETVPFVAELFEDENALVVKNSRRAVQELETILGESLQKYL
ncbi:HEAT repeat-containing protein 1 homolog [Episyrphus balteatus]|uniref:HEAT repeat-containing protein 1 homolog n=1 Tax=Episyrphus balteatus TaxID=286459 RepID=UPI0024859BE6|nr:HEAT repeat-containing protein 1 homolog [Episyrphus balteatus]